MTLANTQSSRQAFRRTCPPCVPLFFSGPWASTPSPASQISKSATPSTTSSPLRSPLPYPASSATSAPTDAKQTASQTASSSRAQAPHHPTVRPLPKQDPTNTKRFLHLDPRRRPRLQRHNRALRHRLRQHPTRPYPRLRFLAGAPAGRLEPKRRSGRRLRARRGKVQRGPVGVHGGVGPAAEGRAGAAGRGADSVCAVACG